jgi:hypothetical protein
MSVGPMGQASVGHIRRANAFPKMKLKTNKINFSHMAAVCI